MSLTISTNIAALEGQRQLMRNSEAQADALRHLASGSRITRAGDDAAGLAISEKMRAAIRSLRQDRRNANDVVSLLQTTEGAMNEVSNILIRLRELSIQSASDTLGDDERRFTNKEVQTLKNEVERISQSTEFNGLHILNGTGDQIEFQVGLHNDPSVDRMKYDPAAVDMRPDAIGISDVATDTKDGARASLKMLDDALNRVNGGRASLGAVQNSLQSTINNLHIYEENLSNARSRVFDEDFALGSSELVKDNIITQSSISVLSQANQSPSLALRLLS